MKTLCAYLLIASFQVSLELFSNKCLNGADTECMRELNLDEKIVLKAFRKDFIVEEGNPDINKFIMCTFKKQGFINDEGNLSFKDLEEWFIKRMDVIVKHYVSKKAEVFDNAKIQCQTITGTDKADTIVKVYNCMVRFLKVVALLEDYYDEAD